MKGSSLLVLLVLAIAGVLLVSLRTLHKERERLMQGFASGKAETARKVASELENRLQDLEEDGRVIQALVSDRAAADQVADHKSGVLLASFRAMATVVRHYRSLVLVDPTGEIGVAAIDPGETKDSGKLLVDLSRQAAARHLTTASLLGPSSCPGERVCYLYAFPVTSGTVFIAVDGARFVHSAVGYLPESTILVRSPGDVIWSGCSTLRTCRALDPLARMPLSGRWQQDAAGTEWIDDKTASALGFPEDRAVAAWQAIRSAETGDWRVTLLASAAAIHAREQDLARQFVATAIALVISISFVGALIVRQQRVAAALAERLRSSERLHALEDQLIRAEKLSTTGVLAAGIAHEIGTPLGIIRARAEILLEDLRDHRSAVALRTVIGQIDRISSTIRQILDFSRAQPVEVKAVNLANAVNSALGLLDHRFKQLQLIISVHVQEALPTVAADPSQLEQVLVNLLLNATDACKRGGHITVSADLESPTSRVRLTIKDDGIGVPARDLLAVFDPFFTTKKRGEGTGLGLSVAASIVRNHGGDISLTSEPPQGAMVTVLWPCYRDEAHVQG